jgi:sugar phosphate isomerase/epimerase
MSAFSSDSVFVSTSCLSAGQSLAERLSLYHSFGLDAVELGMGVSVDKKGLSMLFETAGRYLIHNYFPAPDESFVLNFASADEHIRQLSVDLAVEAVLLAERIGASFYSVHAGFVTDPTGFDRYNYLFPEPDSESMSECALGRFVESLEYVLDRTSDSGVSLLVENNMCIPEMRGKLLLQSEQEFLELFEMIQSRRLGILLDTGHLNVSSRTLGFERMSFVDRLAGYIRGIHVHDNDGITDRHLPIESGSWVLDVLRREEFSELPIIIESKFESITALCGHVDWLKEALETDEILR